jgi:hypothetical protein
VKDLQKETLKMRLRKVLQFIKKKCLTKLLFFRMPSPKSVRISSWNPQDDPYSGQIKTFKLDGSVSKAQFQVEIIQVF